MKTIDNQKSLTLPIENGTPAARVLPFDLENSERAFETATFGLG
jgi:hypothetical protein